MPNASLNASPRHDTCAGIKGRTGATTESLVGGAAAQSGFASWSSGVGSALLRLGAEGPELPQQSLRATLHGLGSGSGTLTTHWLQQAVEVDTGIAKVWVRTRVSVAKDRTCASASAVGPRPRATSSRA